MVNMLESRVEGYTITQAIASKIMSYCMNALMIVIH